MSNNEKPRHRGHVVKFLGEQRCGFIQPEASGAKRVFFHISKVAGDIEPASGDVVTFELGEDGQGRAMAIEVELEETNLPKPSKQETGRHHARN